MTAIARNSRPMPAARSQEASFAALAPLSILAGIAVFFGWWYGRVLFQLPIFGDAANHARISREFLEGHFLTTASPYPPFYNLVTAAGMAVAGEQGFIAVTVISIVALGVAVYFFAAEVTGSPGVGLVSALIAYLSPKTPFYGGRLYMEVFLSVFFVLALVFLHRYLRTRHVRDIALCALACALAAVTKQQGLILLAAPVGVFLLCEELVIWARQRRLPRFLSLRVYLPIVALFVVPALLWQVRNTGEFLPQSDYTAWANNLARSITGFRSEIPAWQQEWDQYLDQSFIDGGYLKTGSISAESRHVWPLEAVTTAEGFFSVNAPFWRHVARTRPLLPEAEIEALSVLFVGGLLIWLVTHRPRQFSLFLAFFLLLNYATFVRNNDQWRYHLFIPYILAFAVPFGVYFLATKLSKSLGHVVVICLALFLILYSTRYLPTRTEAALGYWGGQAYAPSKGGMRSVMDAGAFLKANLPENANFFAVPDTEFAYYVNRPAIYDYRLFFLPQSDLAQVFQDMGVSFIVIPDSAVLADEKWNHLGKAPQSFVAKVSKLYPLAYTTKAGDIKIYEVR
jgi:hypothetical protein